MDYSGTNDLLLYVNGTLVNQVDMGGFVDWAGGNGSALGTDNNNSLISNVSGKTTADFDGEIAKFLFYDRAIDATEIQNNYDFVAEPQQNPNHDLVISAVNGVPGNVGSQITLASGALLTVNADGSYDYDPNGKFDFLKPGDSTTDSFDYTVSNGNGGSDTATVTITIGGVNDNPTAVNDAAVTNEDTPINIDVLANDSDLDGDTISVDSASALHGTVVINSDNTITYTPNANFNGTDTITYNIIDGNGGSASATVDVTINPINDAPVSNDITVPAFDEDSSTTIDIFANISDIDTTVDAANISITITEQPANGLLVDNGDGTLTYTPNANYNGSDSFKYIINDGALDSNESTVYLSINPVNDAPTANDDTYSVQQGSTLNIDAASGVIQGSGADTDIDNDTLKASIISNPSNGVAILKPDGSFLYIPNPGFSGTDSFTYQVSDGNGGISNANVSIDITPVDDNNQETTIIPTSVILDPIMPIGTNDDITSNDPIEINNTKVNLDSNPVIIDDSTDTVDNEFPEGVVLPIELFEVDDKNLNEVEQEIITLLFNQGISYNIEYLQYNDNILTYTINENIQQNQNFTREYTLVKNMSIFGLSLKEREFSDKNMKYDFYKLSPASVMATIDLYPINKNKGIESMEQSIEVNFETYQKK